MSGKELHEHRITFECDDVTASTADLAVASVVTINPFVPSLYGADWYSPTGAFPTITLMQTLGDQVFMSFETERHEALGAIEQRWPHARMLFIYFLNGNWQLFTKIASDNFGLEREPKTAHERTSIAYHALAVLNASIVGTTGSTSAKITSRFARKQSAALANRSHLVALRSRGSMSGQLERDVFAEISRFVDHHESWEMGRLVRFSDSGVTASFESLVLYRDEFSIVRDLYQQGFELACKCLWPLVAAQNSVKRNDPDSFGEDHPASVPVKKRARTLTQFDQLPNAHKIAYAAQVPGWESIAELLSNSHRNTIGHATAQHNLQTGRIVSDKDPNGMTYLEFLGLTFGVFEALTVLAQVLRAARVASSPDFSPSASKTEFP